MKKKTRSEKILFMVQSAIIAAAYMALTYAAGAVNLAYGPIQFRFSEALTILPVFTPAAIPGLALGCMFGNLISPVGPADVIFGSLATLLAALGSCAVRRVTIKGVPWLAPFFPVLVNAVIIGPMVSVLYVGDSSAMSCLICGLQVGLGQLAMCYGLGLPLFGALKKSGLFTRLGRAQLR